VLEDDQERGDATSDIEEQQPIFGWRMRRH
jgi:hypothetical protein